MAILSEQSLVSLSTWISNTKDQAEDVLLKRTRRIIADFQVESTARTLYSSAKEVNYNVALQFPDSLLRDAPLVCEALRVATDNLQDQSGSSTTFLYFILGDTSYGECCVDEVAAQHLNAHVVVHYGNACLSPTRSLPCLYVFPVYKFDQPEVTAAILKSAMENVLRDNTADRLVLLYDSDLSSCMREEAFAVNNIQVPLGHSESRKKISVASLRVNGFDNVQQPGDHASTDEDSVLIGALEYTRGDVPLQSTAFLWLTRQSTREEWPSAVRNAALKLSTGPEPHCAGFYGVCLTEDSESRPSLVDASRILRKRYGVLANAKDAERIGIVPGTLGVSGNMAVIKRCQKVIMKAGKRSYMMLVGKPNPSKLANFEEIDVFVLVACPQNALLDGRDYLRPVVTPMELEAALLADGDIFSEPYSVDFRDLLKREPITENADAIEYGDTPRESALATRDEWSVSVTGNGAAADYLKSRHWKGLTYSSGGVDGETDISGLSTELEMGQSGIAGKYDREVTHNATDS